MTSSKRRAELVDHSVPLQQPQFVLKVSPVVLGDGVGLFGAEVGPRKLVMTAHRTYDNGSAVLRYRPAAT